MNSFFKKYVFVIIMLITCSTVNAQGLGSLLKSAKKVVSDVTSTVNAVSSLSGKSAANPLKDIWRIDSIKAYGSKTSKNFGEVWLVINAEGVIPLAAASLGVKYTVIGGKEYEFRGRSYCDFTLPEGIPMEINLKDKELIWEAVPANATEIQAINIHFRFDPVNGSYKEQDVTWKHIPINWQE